MLVEEGGAMNRAARLFLFRLDRPPRLPHRLLGAGLAPSTAAAMTWFPRRPQSLRARQRPARDHCAAMTSCLEEGMANIMLLSSV